MEKFQNKYRIPSARAVWYDYNEGLYFITICTARRKHYFGEIRHHRMQLNQLGDELFKIINETNSHNEYAEIQLFQIMPNHVHLIVCIDGEIGFKNGAGTKTDTDTETDVDANVDVDIDIDIDIDADVNVDAVCRDAACHVSTENKMREMAKKRGKLSTTIGSMKSALTSYANSNNIPFGWQSRFHDRIIRNQQEFNRIWIYIINNPANWTGDEFFA